jgi:hypothetical protein
MTYLLSHLHRRAKAVPRPLEVDRYYHEVREAMPEYSEEHAWETAWSMYCRMQQDEERCKDTPPGNLTQITRKDIQAHEITVRVATRYQRRNLTAETKEDFVPIFEKTLMLHAKLKAWIRQFPMILRRALQETEGLPSGWVWQKRFIPYFEEYDSYSQTLRNLDDKLEGIYLDVPQLSDQANVARNEATQENRDARIEKAISVIDFIPHPETGQSLIAYKIFNLEGWAKAFSQWTENATKVLQAELRKGKRILR